MNSFEKAIEMLENERNKPSELVALRAARIALHKLESKGSSYVCKGTDYDWVDCREAIEQMIRGYAGGDAE